MKYILSQEEYDTLRARKQDTEAEDIEKRCQQGNIGCVACKKRIAENINAFLDPIREKRAFFEARPLIIKEALRAGIERTLKESRETISLVREAMHFNYKDLLDGKKIMAAKMRK